jgi:hypothetical protein
MYDYAIQQERAHEWSVWSLAPHTGDKREIISTHSTRISALAAIDRLRVADMRKRGESQS